MLNSLFTFEDRETGELRDTLAPNEAAARLELGGVFLDLKRTPFFDASPIGDFDKVIREAQADERTAHAAALAANPMRQGGVTSPEALVEFSALEATHAKADARVAALLALRETL